MQPGITLPHTVVSLPQLVGAPILGGRVGAPPLDAPTVAPIALVTLGGPQALPDHLTLLAAFAAMVGIVGLRGLANHRLRRLRPGGVEPLRWAWPDWQVVSDFIYGFLAAWVANNGWFLRPFMPEPFAQIDPQPGESPATMAGRFFGNLVSITQGIAEFNGGAGMLTGGGLFCAAGALAGEGGVLATCPVAAPALAAGGVLVLHGAGTAISGALAEGELLARILLSIGNGANGTPTGGNQTTTPTTVPAEPQKPPIPDDPAQPPAPGWVWRGNGPPGSNQGSWYNPRTGESLHPDLQHPPPIGPHWDYKDASGTKWRVFPDGRMELK